jgi:hypothetical protein
MPIEFKIYLKKDSLDKIHSLSVIPQQFRQDVRQAGYLMGKHLVKWLKDDMKKPKTGRVYKVYFGVGGKLKKPRLQRASSESETPAVRTGAFRNSVNFIVKGYNRMEFGSGENSNKQYARVLELGSRKMKARKPLQRANENNQDIIKDIASKVLIKLNNYY